MARISKVLTDASVSRFKPPADKPQEDHYDAALPGFAVRISSKGRRTWVLMKRLKSEGKMVRLTLGEYPDMSLADARVKAGEFIDIINAGGDPRSDQEASKKAEVESRKIFSVAKAVEDYEKKHISRLKPRSQLEARRPLEKILLTNWSESKLSDITKAELREILTEMADDGAPVGANRSLAGLMAFFNWCVSEDRLEANPCTGIRPPGGDEISRDRVLSDAEIRFLWPLMEEVGYPYGTIIQMLLITAQRRDEVSSMLWSDITDLDGDTPVWTIPAARNKGGRLHEVPLSPIAVRLLQSLPRIAVTGKDGKSSLSPYVFTTFGSAPFSGFSGGKERLDALADKESCGKPMPRWTPHDLRRTAASIMARADIPPHVVSRVLNHSPGKAEGITSIYNRHGYLKEKRHALETWASKLVH